MRRIGLLLVALLALTVLPLRAQNESADDKTFLENWLEENLSAAGRQVEITGFAGALSSKATMQKLTISDDEGVWFTLTGAELDWTRSALFTGRLAIDAISAQEMDIRRRPVAVSDGPSATASDFALPELPISIDIGKITAERVLLGEPLLGVPAVLRLDGSGWLEKGEGEARLALERIDDGDGRFSIAADYANATRVLGLDLDLSEGQGGIVATLTGLPGGAALDVTLAGRGPIDDFTADLDLATDGVSRLSGQLGLSRGDMEAEGPAPEGAGPVAFRADLSGDPGALVATDYRDFFGPDARLVLAGQSAADGRMRIDRFEVETEAMRLSGDALIGINGWVERARLDGAITPGEGDTVLLPLSVPTRVGGAEIAFDYDVDHDENWTAAFNFNRFDRPDMDIDTLSLTGRGTLNPGENGAVPAISGRLILDVAGLTGAEGTAAASLGPVLRGALDFSRADAAPLELSNIALTGEDYRLSGDASFDAAIDALDLIASGAVELEADDLSRFAPLAGQPLTGAAALSIAGRAALPGGEIDVQIEGEGLDLGIGLPEADRLFAGESRLVLTAARDATGTRIDRLNIAATGARLDASGSIVPGQSQVSARLELPDAALLAEGLSGPASFAAEAVEEGASWRYSLDGAAPGGLDLALEGTLAIVNRGVGRVQAEGRAAVGDLSAYAALARRPLTGRADLTVSGSYDVPTSAFDVAGSGTASGLSLGLGQADVLIAGDNRLAFDLNRDEDGTIFIDKVDLASANLTLAVTGESAGGVPRITAKGRLRDLALFVPGLPGAFTLEGTAALGDDGWQVTGSGDGPGGTAIQTSGTIAADGAGGNLSIKGQAPLGLANGFIAPRQVSGMANLDLRLSGPFALTSLSGRVSTGGARLSMPTLNMAFEPITASAVLSAGRATVDVVAASATGGRVTVKGPVTLSPPFNGDLTVRLDSLRIVDPALFDLDAEGQLKLSGPLSGGGRISGRVTLGDVELQVPETGFGVNANLENLRHVGEPADVYATRERAGLVGKASGAGASANPFQLDVIVRAPRAVFIRGRGLDAELGGRILLTGDTSNVIASGGFRLLRGRLDLLGNRLDLTEGNVTLRGSLDPAIYLVAETQAEDIIAMVVLDGPLSEPKITFTSSPELPEEEILARLIFGRSLEEISPFQALKLASAVATLSGRGGAGTIGRLREGFGLADLDITTDEEGSMAATVGAYISDRIYTDVTVDAEGRAAVNLNLSISPSLTVKGGVASDGDTSVGIFFEKDY